MKIKRFEELPVWKLALELTKVIYDFTAQLKFSKDFVLRDQIRRAVISISSNIVEGFEKNNNNEFIRYLKISKGSAGETRNQLFIAFSVGYISKGQFDKTNQKLEDLASQIGGLISYLEKCRSQGKFISKKTANSQFVNPLIRNEIIKKTVIKTLLILLITGLNWIGLLAVSETFAYYNDTETSSKNSYSAATLDFSIPPVADFSPKVTPTQNSIKDISITKDGVLDFEYNLKTENETGDLCDYLNLTITRDGSGIGYAGTLKDFTYNAGQFSDPDQWQFTANLTSDDAALQNQSCNFDFVFDGAQIGGAGFSDQEIIPNIIDSGIWQEVVINKVYYDVDDEHRSGSGADEWKNEWIELYNPTNQAVNLKNWVVCDNYDCVTIHPNVSIPALGYVLLSHDASTWQYWEIPIGVEKINLGGAPYHLELANTADMLTLKDADGNVIDQMNWGTPISTWTNYNSNLWNPGLVPTGDGGMAARASTGLDTDTVSDWKNLELPTVSMVYPVGGEVWYVGDYYDVEWIASNSNSGGDGALKISLWYSNDSGNTWAEFASNLDNTGVYNWRVPLLIGSYYVPSHNSRIRAIATGPENFMVQAVGSSLDFCPPVDYSMLTDEEKAQVEQLLADGILTEADIINKGTTTAELTGEAGGVTENLAITNDGVVVETAIAADEETAAAVEDTAVSAGETLTTTEGAIIEDVSAISDTEEISTIIEVVTTEEINATMEEGVEIAENDQEGEVVVEQINEELDSIVGEAVEEMPFDELADGEISDVEELVIEEAPVIEEQSVAVEEVIQESNLASEPEPAQESEL